MRTRSPFLKRDTPGPGSSTIPTPAGSSASRHSQMSRSSSSHLHVPEFGRVCRSARLHAGYAYPSRRSLYTRLPKVHQPPPKRHSALTIDLPLTIASEGSLIFGTGRSSSPHWPFPWYTSAFMFRDLARLPDPIARGLSNQVEKSRSPVSLYVPP